MKIRKARVKDVENIHKIGVSEKYFEIQEGITDFWDEIELKKWIQSKDDVCLVVEEEKKVLGFLLSIFHKPSGKVILENLWVDPSLREKGIAKEMISFAVTHLKEKGATYFCAMVNENNKNALKLLEKMNFNKGLKFYWMDLK